MQPRGPGQLDLATGWPHLEAAESHIHLAAALVGTVEHLQQAISIHHP